MKDPGHLIAISGVDGSGKSTLAAGVAAAIQDHGHRVLQVSALKPRSPSLARWARQVELETGLDARERWLAGYFTLVLADNAVALCRPELARGTWVVADRWLLDHLANQRAFGVELDEWLPWLTALPRPDTHLLLDVPAEVAEARVAAREGPPGIGQGAGFLDRCVKEMRSLAGQASASPVTVLDGGHAPDAVLDAAMKAVWAPRPGGGHR
ncbi:hypothetical protein [Streptomyces hainanensis]|uniref:hypothetical protein n=1 Tax=Streptomyces hainanensis TaxID=402648 RepID=UPI0014054296|nr:hypothetical protein [Streptomyces hainanensis]